MATNNCINVQAPNKPLNAVSGTTVLTATAFGKLVTCAGSSAYTVTLPSVTGNAGKYIDFEINTTSSAIVTITPASGTIDGQTNVKYCSFEGCTIYCDGTNWIIVWQSLANVMFGQSPEANTQTLTSNTLTVLNLFTNNYYNINGGTFDAANGKYTPTYPGKYFINLWCGPNNNISWTAGGNGQLQLIGTNQSAITIYSPLQNAQSRPSYLVSGIFSFNGTTDNVVLKMNLNVVAGTVIIGSDDRYNEFQATRIGNY